MKAGLKMNIKKTNVMICNRLQDNTITVDDKIIEKVDHYTYFGKNISLENETSSREVKRRIQLTWAKFGKLCFIFCDKDLTLTLKKQMFNRCIIPVLSYGSETWTTTKKLEKKLRFTERAMDRIMVGVTRKDRVRNTHL